MTDNDRPETKREKFERLRDARVPKITHAMGIVENLAGAGYESTPADRQALVNELQAAVDRISEAFQVPTRMLGSPEPTPKPIECTTPKAKICTDDAQPSDPAEGGALAKHEIAWAYDAVQRKDWKLAANRLKRVIDMWRN